MILPSYAAMRGWFAVPLTTVSGAADNGSGLVRLTVASTSSITTGVPIWVSGVLGTVEANGPYTPTVIDATHIDLAGSTFTNAYTSGGKVYLLDPDGFPSFPGPRILYGTNAGAFDNTGATGTLRASGFSLVWSVLTQAFQSWNSAQIGPAGPLIAGASVTSPLFPMLVSCNNGAADGSPGNADYAWYLSQRSDGLMIPGGTPSAPLIGPQPQPLTITHNTYGFSGTVQIDVVPAEVTKLFPGSGGVPPTDLASLQTLLRFCRLYVQRRSDKAYTHVSLITSP